MGYPKSDGKLLSVTMDEILNRLSRLETHIIELEKRTDLAGSRSQRRNPATDRPQATGAQLKMLKFLSNNPKGGTSNEIQSGTKLAKATVSVGLKNLTDIGAVERIPSTKRGSRYRYVLAEEIPHEIKRMMELLEVELQERI